jgi:stage V sporulation protein B
MAFVQIQITILQSIGKLYSALVAISIGIIAKIITNYVLVAIPSINIMGAVYANIIYFLIPMLMNMYSIRKALKIRVRIMRSIIRPAIASALMGIVVYLSYYNLETLFIGMKTNPIIKCALLGIPVLIGGVVYVYGLILTGGITKRDLETLSPRIIRLIPSFIKNRIR